MSTLFSSLLAWVVQFVLFVPFTLLKLVGLLLPPCSSIGFVSFGQDVLVSAAQWIRFAWPVIGSFPWVGVWNLVAAMVLYFLFKFLWKLLPRLMQLGTTFWIIVFAVYLLSSVVSFITGMDWASSPVFTEVFGDSATSSGFSGGGGAGGGGGSW